MVDLGKKLEIGDVITSYSIHYTKLYDTMLMNQVVSAEGELPTCQDTGTAIVVAKKGEDVYTGANDAELLSKGIFDTYSEKNLRYSQVVPFTMLDEKNTGTNLPAQIDIYAEQGNKYEFLFITKGGGSGNKTYLYQQTKSLLTEENLTKFVKDKIMDLGTSACPPYHLALVIGGTSAEATLSAVKKASAGYYDVITSYSIHYTKLYDWMKPPAMFSAWFPELRMHLE